MTEQRTVLVVDDEDDIRETICEFLARDGHGVLAARNGCEAIKILQGPRLPDVILLDMMMPVMCGEEFLRSIAQNPSWIHVPIIVMTAANLPAQPCNTAALIRKPFRMAQIRAALERCWGAGN